MPVGGVRVVRRILQRWERFTSRAFPVGVCPGLLGPEGKENALCVSDELWSHTCHTGHDFAPNVEFCPLPMTGFQV